MRSVTRTVAIVMATMLLSGMLMTGNGSAAEALCNGGFEDGEACWTEFSFPEDSATVVGSPGHTGSAAAAFCSTSGGASCLGQFFQEYTVPSDVTSAVLNFWYFAATEDGEANCDDGVVGGVVVPGSEEQLLTGVCSEEVTPDVWTERTLDVTAFLQAHAGQVIMVAVAGRSNYESENGADEKSSIWYVDDISLDVEGNGNGGGRASFSRTVELTLRRHLTARGLLPDLSPPDGHPACILNVDLKVQKRRGDGTWNTIKTITTDDQGTYRTGIPDRPGRYRVKAPRFEVPEIDGICLEATSPVRRHRH